VHIARWLASALRPPDDGGPECFLDGSLDVEAEPALLTSTPDEEREAARWLCKLPAGFVAIHPGSGSPAKSWPAERFRDLQRLLAPGQATLVVLGPAEAHLAAMFADDSGAGAASSLVAQALSLRVLGAVLAQAGLFVGNDSGVSHLAAAWGAPTLALFGPTDPRTWSPEGRRVQTLRATGDRIDQLALEDVRRVAEEMRQQTRVG
jgi:ADP-heptose:LPS heptosyltransferase